MEENRVRKADDFEKLRKEIVGQLEGELKRKEEQLRK